jgi:Raf kinase inhibitor-like YbhB/YbcL family protein
MDNSIFAGIAVAVLQVTSISFSNNGNIPSKFTCEGENISPAISVKGIPQETKSLAILVEDPDAPNGTVIHWAAWNIDPAGNIAEKSILGTQGKNSRGANGYMGPCPPTGTHHYHFKVFALDRMLGVTEGSSKEQLEAAMKGHIVGEGELVGLYQKSK